MNRSNQLTSNTALPDSLLNKAGVEWIICDSKSRPGLKYFFNIKSNKSVWNLSDGEIRNAQQQQKVMINSNLENIPEPKGLPPMNPTLNTSGMLNNQLINICSLLNSGTSNNVWATPPAIAQSPQFLLVPTMAPLVNATSDLNQNQMLALQNTSIAQTPSHTHQNQMYSFQNAFSLHNKRRPNNNRNTVHNFNRSLSRNRLQNLSSPHHNSDLRQKLARKRSITESYGTFEQTHHNKRKYCAIVNREAVSEDTGERKNNSIVDFLNSESCYIIPDTDAILSDFAFLDNLIDKFHIVIPHHVMSQLTEYACQYGDVRIRRIIRFLSQKIESQLVRLGKQLDHKSFSANTEKMLMTCYELAADNNNIILVTNDTEMLNKSQNERIEIVTMSQLKEILSNIKFNVPPRFTSPTRAIKIIVPNEIETSSNSHNNYEGEVKSPSKSPSILSKQNVDFGIQTNINEIDALNTKHLNETVDEIDTINSSFIENSISNSNSVKNREVKLNRSTLVRTAVEEQSDKIEQKKRFRWSKRRIKTHNNSQNNHTITETDLKNSNNKSQSQMSTNSCYEGSLKSPNINIIQDGNKSDANVTNIVPESPKYQTSSSNTNTSTKPKECIIEPQNKCKPLTLRNCKMFEIAGQFMEDALKTRCDEWISRFVQIMEEILREKLQEHPSFESKDFPPPWNLHEAAKCIIKKFSDYCNVVDAANKLSFVLYKISDNKGKILMNIKPSEYMEMYSYGVYLIETLQDVIDNCEDLKIASDSLKKLLYDIHNVNLDNPHNDIFCDDLHETVVEHSMTIEDSEPQPQSSTTSNSSSIKSNKKSKTSSRNKVDGRVVYRLRSATKKHSETEGEEKGIISKPDGNNKSSFMFCLNLKSTNSPSSIGSSLKSPTTSLTTKNISKTPSIQSPNKTSTPQNQKINTVTNEECNSNDKNKENTANTTVTHEFIRNFHTCPEFEERLKKSRAILELNDYTDEDNPEDCWDDTEQIDQAVDNYGYFPSNTNQSINKSQLDNWKVNISSSTKDMDNENHNFKNFMNYFLGDITNTLTNVQLMCDELIKHQSDSKRFQNERLKSKAEQTSVTLENINKSLNRILLRDTTSDTGITALLKDANVEFTDEMCLKYRDAVRHLRNQAVLFIQLLKLLSAT